MTQKLTDLWITDKTGKKLFKGDWFTKLEAEQYRNAETIGDTKTINMLIEVAYSRFEAYLEFAGLDNLAN